MMQADILKAQAELEKTTSMAILTDENGIVVWPSDILTRVCEKTNLVEAAPIWAELSQKLSQWRYKGFRGVGLAAPQIGRSKQVFVMMRAARTENLRVVLNPMIKRHGKQIFKSKEGCLSTPGKTKELPRFEVIDVEYMDRMGNIRSETFKRNEAAIFQHEFDHLAGICKVCEP